ncbi:DUF3558 domain-containing protein [Actinokineospora bangkokensis]|uniref:DUF3558 domain-containing protein n=1 Tax=Actinokineospora bangkokensis TaxID=1193682 RepID=A0A1Q9LDU0_9PSEU|nr:DUF3558 domain-containing protein [Actinokineospora bangkokensis]OLR90207.1 hypothetical protein BJP25_04420 [Actinokineospora bangkokensis]
MRAGRLLVVSVVAVTAGCSTATPGQPVPQEVGAAPSASGSAPVDLADLDPCGLLTESARAELDAAPGKRARDLPSSTGCQWKVNPGAAISESYTVDVAIYPELGTDRITSTGAKTPMSVNSRPAVRFLGAGGSVCVISLEVSATSRVDVSANGAGTNDGALLCPRAETAAELIEPELPPAS